MNAFASRDTVFFGRHEDGVLENEFSGNLVEICPTGVFTDKTHKRHYARKWDQQFAPSVCVHCALGCNTNTGERYGTVRRIVNRYNHEVNGYFLCDRGRFGYEFVNSERRYLKPVLKGQRVLPLRRPDMHKRKGRRMAVSSGLARRARRLKLTLRYALWWVRTASIAGWPIDEAKLVGRTIEILRRVPMRTPTSTRDREMRRGIHSR